MKPTSITESLPPALRAKLEIDRHDNDRDEREVAWYYRFLEMGNETEAALFAGFEDDKAAHHGRRLKKKFAGIIREGLVYVGQADLPLALETLRRVMRAYDPEARISVVKTLKNGDVLEYEDADPVRSSPAAASAAVKAAESYMDRLGMPKGFVLEIVESGADKDYRMMVDQIVAQEGVAAVRLMPSIMGFREYREYFEEGVAAGKYGQGIIDVTPDDPAPQPFQPKPIDDLSDLISKDPGLPWTDTTPDSALESSGAGDDVPTSALSPAGPDIEPSSEPDWL